MTDKTDELIENLKKYSDDNSLENFKIAFDILSNHISEIDFSRGCSQYTRSSIVMRINDWMHYGQYQGLGIDLLYRACYALREQLDESKKEIAWLNKQLAEKEKS